MPNIGPMELIVVLVIALLVLGPKRLPDAGRSVGKGLREFKDAISGGGNDDDDRPLTPIATAQAAPVAPATPVDIVHEAPRTPAT